MSITKEALEYVNGLKEQKLHEINGAVFSTEKLFQIVPGHEPAYHPTPIKVEVNGLDSLAKLVRREIEAFGVTLYIQILNERNAQVFSTYNEELDRVTPYSVKADTPTFAEGFRDPETAIVQLRSKFIPNEGTNYLLDLLSRISKENGVTTSDNGVSQTVEARQGISLKVKEAIKPRVKLIPYRTFLEIEQPESEFLFRIDDGGNVGFFEADGGMWKQTAKKRIAEYFERELSDLIESGGVIVMG